MAKIGRNRPCPCGSGKKYKRCHGNVAPTLSANSEAIATAVSRAREAKDILRRRAEGHGRPIVSGDVKGFRVVQVGGRRYLGGNWPFFTDFLLDHMKNVLGRGWGKKTQASGSSHPVMQWLKRLNEIRDRSKATSGNIVEAVGEGAAMAVFRFAYALYLIAHHDEVPAPLVRRLRRPSEFQSAALETIVVAAFALAGFKIEMGEVRKGNTREGEFSATSPKTGTTFNVEAKRKRGWSAPVEPDDEAFQSELTRWIQRNVYKAARKRLQNPIYWLELSLPSLREQEQAEKLDRLVRSALREAEDKVLVEGEKPSPAYIFVTSHSYLVGEGNDGSIVFMLDGFHIRIPQKGDVIEVEQALAERDRDRDVTWVFDCFQQVQHVPHNFDGVPDSLMDDDKRPISRLQVGERLEVTFEHRDNVSGIVTDVVSSGPTAHVVLHDEQTGKQSIVEIPLTDEEQQAAAAFGDVVFGNPAGGKSIADDDPLAIYDFFLGAYAQTPREKLLELLSPHPQFAEFQGLKTEELRQRLCREWAKSVIANHQPSRRAAKQRSSERTEEE